MTSTPKGYSEPIPCNLRRPKIWSYAEEVALRLGYKPGLSLEQIVSGLGGKLRFKDAKPGTDRLPESMLVTSFKDFVIFLPHVTSPSRDRFTICHELGHYFLHYPIAISKHPGKPMRATRWVDKSNPIQVRAEWEANWFAAAFLMPEKAFIESYNSRGAGLTAVRFDVSDIAVENRAKSLSLISA